MTDADDRQSATSTPSRNEVSSRYVGVDRALASLKKTEASDEPAPDPGAKPPGYFTKLAQDRAAGRI